MDNFTAPPSLLFDFYGELLTERQKDIFDLHYNEDLSLSEISELRGISRQGVWDILRRTEASLAEYEQKTGIVERYLERSREIGNIRNELERILPKNEQTLSLLARLDGLK